MLEDIHQLPNIIVSAPPDPYPKVGRRSAYHRRLQMLMGEPLAEGTMPKEFGFALMRLILSLKDSHTAIQEDPMLLDSDYPGE